MKLHTGFQSGADQGSYHSAGEGGHSGRAGECAGAAGRDSADAAGSYCSGSQPDGSARQSMLGYTAFAVSCDFVSVRTIVTPACLLAMTCSALQFSLF